MRASSPAWIYASLFTSWLFSWAFYRGPWGDAAAAAVVTALIYWGSSRPGGTAASLGRIGDIGFRVCAAISLPSFLWITLTRIEWWPFAQGFALAVYLALVIRADGGVAAWQGRLCTLLGIGVILAGMLRMRAGWEYGWNSAAPRVWDTSPSLWFASDTLRYTVPFAAIAGVFGEPLRADQRRWPIAIWGFLLPILAVAAVMDFRRESAFFFHHKAGRIFSDLVIGGSLLFRPAQGLLLWMTTFGTMQFAARSMWRMAGSRTVYWVLCGVAWVGIAPDALFPVVAAIPWLLCLAGAIFVADALHPPAPVQGPLSAGAMTAMAAGFGAAHLLPLEASTSAARIIPSMALTLLARLAMPRRFH